MPGLNPHPVDISPQLAAERASHDAFAASRRYGHVPRPLYLDRLTQHALSSGPPLVIHAPSGAGKSALLAYWVESFRAEHPDAFVVEHFIGVGSSDHLSLIRHIMLEIREHFGVLEELPSTPERLESALPAWLWYVDSGDASAGDEATDDDAQNNQGESDRRMILLVDALNQLGGAGGDLYWLPDHISPSVRLVTTTTSQTTLELLAQRGWETMSLPPFTLKERQEMVERFVAERTTSISGEQVQGVASAAGSANPLLLRTKLEEMRMVQGQAKASQTIKDYLGARDLDEMYERVLARLEEEHGAELVGDVTSLLQISRGGLSTSEIAGILAASHEEVERLIERLAFHLLWRDEVITFVHEYISSAVKRRYLGDAEHEREVRLHIAEYFASRPVVHRTAVETAYQLDIAEEYELLKDHLSQIPVMMDLYQGESQFEFLVYWRKLSDRFDIVEAYTSGLAEWRRGEPDPEEVMRVGESLGRVLQIVGRWEMARDLYREELEIAEKLDARGFIARAAGNLGMVHYRRGEYDAAMEYYIRQSGINEELGDLPGISTTLSNMAAVHFSRGEYASAMEKSRRKLQICQQIGDKRGIAMSYGGIGSIHVRLGDQKQGMENLNRQLAISEEIGDRRDIALTLGNIGSVYTNMGDTTNARNCFERQLMIAEEIGDASGISNAIGHLGVLLIRMKEHDAAMDLLERQLVIAEKLGDKREIASTLGSMATVHYDQGRLPEAIDFARQQLAIARDIGDRHAVIQASLTIGEISSDSGELSEALAHYESALEIAREIGSVRYRLGALLGIARVTLRMVQRSFDHLDHTHNSAALERAQSWSSEALAGAIESGEKEMEFEGRLLLASIGVTLKGEGEMPLLESMLEETTDELHRGAIYEEIAFAHYIAGHSEQTRSLAQEALAAYERAEEESQIHEKYRLRINELVAMVEVP